MVQLYRVFYQRNISRSHSRLPNKTSNYKIKCCYEIVYVLNFRYFKNIIITNATLTRTPEKEYQMGTQGVGIMPNGIIKTTAAFHDDIDENIVTFAFWSECYKHNESFNGNVF